MENSNDPFTSNIVLVTDKFGDTVAYEYVKSNYTTDTKIYYDNIEDFYHSKHWLNTKYISKFIPEEKLDIVPLFKIDKYDVYNIKEKGYIIESTDVLDLEIHESYGSLSIALIYYNL